MKGTTSYKISDADFTKVQIMARLTLTGEEKEKIHSQLDEALKAVQVFDELNLVDVPPLAHPGELENVMRDDVITKSFTQEEALSNTPASYQGFVMVPHVLGESSS